MMSTDTAGVSNSPRITVVTVTYNAASSLEQTIQSVLNLRYNNLEYIVIDGGSTDGTVDIIRQYASRIDFWVSEKDGGIYDGMNKAIDRATGEWINFMNAGDRFASPEALEFFRALKERKDIYYGDAIVEYPSFQSLFVKHPLPAMWKQMPFCHQATFASVTLMKMFKFDLRYRLSSDFGFLYRAYLEGKSFQYVNCVICYFDFTQGASKSSALRSIRERQQIVLSLRFGLEKWLYFRLLTISIWTRELLKKLFGDKITAWITKLLRA